MNHRGKNDRNHEYQDSNDSASTPDLIPDDAVARDLIIVYNISSQRPHLNYLFLSNVYSFDTIEFSMKHKY